MIRIKKQKANIIEKKNQRIKTNQKKKNYEKQINEKTHRKKIKN